MMFVLLIAKMTSLTIAFPAILSALIAQSWVGWVIGIAATVTINELAMRALLYTHVHDPLKMAVSAAAACLWFAATLWVRRLIRKRRTA